MLKMLCFNAIYCTCFYFLTRIFMKIVLIFYAGAKSLRLELSMFGNIILLTMFLLEFNHLGMRIYTILKLKNAIYSATKNLPYSIFRENSEDCNLLLAMKNEFEKKLQIIVCGFFLLNWRFNLESTVSLLLHSIIISW